MLILTSLLLAGAEQSTEETRVSSPSINSLRRMLHTSSVAFIPGHVTSMMLQNYMHEGSVADASVQASFAKFWDAAVPQQDEEGHQVYKFKNTLVSYYALTGGNDGPIRMTDKAYSSAPPSVIEYIDPTTRHNVSYFRVHRSWPDDADAHPLARAMLSLINEVIQQVGADDSDEADAAGDGASKATYEAMMSAFRVRRSYADPQYQAGEPGPEGVHQDSAVLTAIVLLDRVNVASDSGGNRVWSLEQPAGKPLDSDLHNASRLLASPMLRRRFDMLLVMDREVKHEACAIEPADLSKAAVRDVLTFEVRRLPVRVKVALSTQAGDEQVAQR